MTLCQLDFNRSKKRQIINFKQLCLFSRKGVIMQPKRDNKYINTMKTYKSRISISLLLIVTVACFVPVAFVSIEEMWHVAVAMLPIYSKF